MYATDLRIHILLARANSYNVATIHYRHMNTLSAQHTMAFQCTVIVYVKII